MIDEYYSSSDIVLFGMEWFEKYIVIAIWSIISSVIELYLIFKLSIYMVHNMTSNYGYDYKTLSDSYILGFDFLLSRLVVGVEEPPIILDGINAYQNHNKFKKFLKKFFYTIRITLSNTIMKIIIRKIFIQNGLRINIEWISTIVIGFWNAIALYLLFKKVRNILEDMKQIDRVLDRLDLDKKNDDIEIYYRLIANLFVIAEHNVPTLQYLYFELKKRYPLGNTDIMLDSYEDLLKILENKEFKELKKIKNIYDTIIGISNLKNQKATQLSKELTTLLTLKDSKKL